MHLVYYNTKYGSYNESLKYPDRRAVVAVFVNKVIENTIMIHILNLKLHSKRKAFDACNEVSFIHQDNMPVKCIPPYTPFLYSKTGVYRGILFSYFCSKT